jgi:hypothetical protein
MSLLLHARCAKAGLPARHACPYLRGTVSTALQRKPLPISLARGHQAAASATSPMDGSKPRSDGPGKLRAELNRQGNRSEGSRPRTRGRLTERGASTRRGRDASGAGRRAVCSLSSVKSLSGPCRHCAQLKPSLIIKQVNANEVGSSWEMTRWWFLIR